MDQLVLLHLSDLHIGEKIGANSLELLPGMRSHHFRLCEAVTLAARRVRARFTMAPDSSLFVCISGDLTRCGYTHEFSLAHTFIHSQWVLSTFPATRAGLAAPCENVAAVPGNHDHWGGVNRNLFHRRPPAFLDDTVEGNFEQTPWCKTFASAEGTFALELLGIDSNAGLRGKQTNLRASGKLSPRELDRARSLLRTSDAAHKKLRIRAIVSHHGLSSELEENNYRQHFVPEWHNAQQLDGESREELLRLAADCRLSALLTGHMHSPLVWPHAVPRKQGAQELWEFRSSTAVQGPPADYVQGFFVHQLVRAADADSITWNIWRYDWFGQRFYCAREPIQSFEAVLF